MYIRNTHRLGVMDVSPFLVAALFSAAAFGQAQPKKPVLPKPAAPASPAVAPARSPTPEELSKAAAIKDDISKIERSIFDSQAESEKLAGGLIKARIEARIAQMRYTISLLQTRQKALELGARLIPLEVSAATVNQAEVERLEKEIDALKVRISETDAKAAQYSGGLIRAQVLSTSATMSETLALLEQRMMAAKYGLVPAPAINTASPPPSASGSNASTAKNEPLPKEAPLAETIVKVRLSNKEYQEQKYDKGVFFSGEYLAEGLDKPARSIKGVFKVQDLFGETKVSIKWTLTQPLSPGQSQSFSGKGIDYNQFNNSHQWLKNTHLSDMQVVYAIESILYEDGTRRDFR